MTRSRWLGGVLIAMIGPVAVWAGAQAGSPAQLAAISGTERPGSQVPTYQANANLVLVDVVVRDKRGPIEGLKASDFQVAEDGQPQTITTFEEHRATDAVQAVEAPPLPPHVYSNAPTYRRTSAVNVLLLDALNTEAHHQTWVRQRMVKYLHLVPPGTQLAVFTLASRLRMVSGFTTDVGMIEQALGTKRTPIENSRLVDPGEDAAEKGVTDAMLSSMPAAEEGAMAQEVREFEADRAVFQGEQRLEITLAAMDELGRYLSEIPGRKNLIWFSGAFPMQFSVDEAGGKPAQLRDFSPQVMEIEAQLARARVAVYPADARGLLTMPLFGDGGMDAGADPQAAVGNDEAFLNSVGWPQVTMREIARQTGGEAYVNTNAVGQAVEKAIADGSSYYTLGYAPKRAEMPGQYRTIAVKVEETADRGQYELSYRRGYFTEDPGQTGGPASQQLSPMSTALEHGAPPLSQLIFQVRVLAADDPAARGMQAASGPAGDLAKTLQGPVERYLIDATIDPRALVLKPLAGGWQRAELEIAVEVLSADGVRLNGRDHGVQIDVAPRNGVRPLHLHEEIDVPAAAVSLRVAVRDVASGRIGTVEVQE